MHMVVMWQKTAFIFNQLVLGVLLKDKIMEHLEISYHACQAGSESLMECSLWAEAHREAWMPDANKIAEGNSTDGRGAGRKMGRG